MLSVISLRLIGIWKPDKQNRHIRILGCIYCLLKQCFIALI